MSPRLRKRAAALRSQMPGVAPQKMVFSMSYLSIFGYIATHLLEKLTLDDIKKAIKVFQSWFGIKGEEGELGPKTVKAMMTPRCGCPEHHDGDNDTHAGYQRMRAFVAQAATRAHWKKNGLKYYIKSWVHDHDVSKTAQREIYAKAWNSWDRLCGIQISETSTAKSADLLIDTGKGFRDDFDGPGGTLAWAYMPDGSDRQIFMKFDLTETWQATTGQGIRLENVACHEFGHMLGLDHSRVRGALMAPYYDALVSAPAADDITRIRTLYGPDMSTRALVGAAPDAASDAAPYVLRCSGLSVEGFDLVPKA